MITIAYYFLQVVLCSAILMGYYLLVLRNKKFHQYNRFYLLTAALLSWIVPLVKINWSQPPRAITPQVYKLLFVVAESNTQLENNIAVQPASYWSGFTVAAIVYILVSFGFLLLLFKAMRRIFLLVKENECKSIQDVYLVLTKANGTPFSFFRYIFWNEEIDLDSQTGQQMLQHEIVHVSQKHSIDKVFIQVMMIGGWFNPFFWLIKRELEMIHEFIADKKSVGDGDSASLAKMLLAAAYPQQKFMLTNPFFFSPIKRRLKMLIDNKNPKFSYARRMVVLPLLAIVVILFSFRKGDRSKPVSFATVIENVSTAVKKIGADTIPPVGENVMISDIARLDKTYTVVIDAGHGGSDQGTVADDGTTEAALNLKLAEKIKALNANENINIVLRRNTDIYQHNDEIVNNVNASKPDLYIAVHANTAASVTKTKATAQTINGIELYIPSDKNAYYYGASEYLANTIYKSMELLGQKMIGIKSKSLPMRMEKIKAPAVLIEAGFMSNPKELSLLENNNYQDKIANSILNGINAYFGSAREEIANLDTVHPRKPFITMVDDTIVHVRTAGQRFSFDKPGGPLKAPRYILNDKRMDSSWTPESLQPDEIKDFKIYNKDQATEKFGDWGSNGVIVIDTRVDRKAVIVKKATATSILKDSPKYPHFVIDGVRFDNSSEAEALDPETFNMIKIYNPKQGAEKFGAWGETGVIEVHTTRATGIKDDDNNIATETLHFKKTLIVLNGIKMNKDFTLKSLSPDEIYAVNILEEKQAIKKYGKEGSNGAMEVSTRPKKK